MADLAAIAGRLVAVGGVVGVLLGGSRARGTHHPDSDVDLGVYYRPPLDVDGLAALARELAGPRRDGDPARRLGAVGRRRRVALRSTAWPSTGSTATSTACGRPGARAQDGRVAWQAQVGHPLGVLDVWYAAEVALGVVLADPSGELTRLHDRGRGVPGGAGGDARRAASGGRVHPGHRAQDDPPRRRHLRRGLPVPGARGVRATRCTPTRGGGWSNEKGLIAAAGALPGAPAGLRGPRARPAGPGREHARRAGRHPRRRRRAGGRGGARGRRLTSTGDQADDA